MSFMSLIPIIPLYQAGRMVAEDLELTVETLRCKEDKEASGLVKKVELQYTGSLKKVMNRILRAMLGDQIFRLKWPKVVQSGPN